MSAIRRRCPDLPPLACWRTPRIFLPNLDFRTCRFAGIIRRIPPLQGHIAARKLADRLPVVVEVIMTARENSAGTLLRAAMPVKRWGAWGETYFCCFMLVSV